MVLGIADLHLGDVVKGVNHHVDDPKMDVMRGASSNFIAALDAASTRCVNVGC